MSTSVTNCKANSSLATVRSNVQDNQACELFASDTVFGPVKEHTSISHWITDALEVNFEFN